jgi:diguanylate cyclase (GGDEF)-like protein
MPAKKQASGKLRLGLAGRVALIGCIAATLATVAQWGATPLLLKDEFDRARLVYASSAAEQLAMISAREMTGEATRDLSDLAMMMARPLPRGEAAIVSREGAVLGATPRGFEIARTLDPRALAGSGDAMLQGDNLHVGVHPIVRNGETLGAVVVAFQPKPLGTVWLAVVWRNALVLALALAVLAPFMLPMARKALSPVTDLEKRIRGRSPSDKSRLADQANDTLLTPLLAAIDEVHDRSEAASRRALRIAFADPLTRLPNRLRFMSKLERCIDRRGPDSIFMVLVDLDGFRKINVALGPNLADAVLVQVGARLRASAAHVSSALFVGRLGTDQFGVIAPGADRASVQAFMAMADKDLSEPMVIDGQTLRVSASFGAACTPDDADTAVDLLKQSELALKEAKSIPSRRAFFDVKLVEKARAQSQLENDIRLGLERNEFVAAFQPKVKLETGELVGAEALARWRRPNGDIVSPGVFVPIIEEMGLISKLGVCILRDACFAAAAWNAGGPPRHIAVNVSPHQFSDPDFISTVYQALDDSGLDPRLLELEITESAAVNDPDRVARIMWPLRNRGVRLAIDDFGTGHSNFTSLTRLPFDVFKIDQQFVRGLATDPNASAIVEMILAMAEALGHETVAEGVETAEQADFLLRRNCMIGQGYHFSPPLPAAEFEAFVRSWRPRPARKFAA